MASNLDSARILLQNGATVYLEERAKKSPFYEAVKKGDEEMIRLLFSFLETKQEFENDASPLFACFENFIANPTSLEILLDLNFDPNVSRGHERKVFEIIVNQFKYFDTRESQVFGRKIFV